jgi:predicted nucleotidyltransferase
MIAVARVAAEFSEAVSSLVGLRLLVGHGSRARSDAHERSDWDFAYLADDGFDELELRARLARALRTDDVDVVDLARGGRVLRYRVARDGVPVFERDPRVFEGFCYDAILFWLDAQRVIRSAHDEILARLE